jgi:hypothetical protein
VETALAEIGQNLRRDAAVQRAAKIRRIICTYSSRRLGEYVDLRGDKGSDFGRDSVIRSGGLNAIAERIRASGAAGVYLIA